MKTLHYFVIVTLSLALGACSLGGPLRKDEKASSYKMGSLPAEWIRQSDKDGSNADVSFVNSKRGAVIALSSICKRYDRVPLEQLKADLVNPLEGHEVLSEERRPLDDREALYTRARGKLDGVPVESSLVVLRKNDCIFDFSIFAREKISAEDNKAFVDFVNGFHFVGGQ